MAFLLCLIFITPIFGQSHYNLASSHYELALEAYRSNKLEISRTEVDMSIHHHPTAQAYYLSARIYEAVGLPIRALADYESVVQHDPTFSEAYFSKGLIYLNYNNAEQALQDFNYLIENGSNGATRSILFEVDPSGAGETSILTLESMQARVYNYRAMAYEKLGRNEMALQDFNQSLELEANADTYVNRGLLFFSMNREVMAIADFEKAIRLDPYHQLAWYNLAIVNPGTRLPSELVNDNTFAPTLNLLAVEALEKGQTDKALKYFNTALRSGEDALTLINRGRTYQKLGYFEEARRDFNRAQYLEPNRVETNYLIGNTYFSEKEFERALAFYYQYLSIDPTHGLTWYNAAMAQLELENREEACHCLTKAQIFGMKKAEEMIQKKCVEN